MSTRPTHTGFWEATDGVHRVVVWCYVAGSTVYVTHERGAPWPILDGRWVWKPVEVPEGV